MKGNKIYRSSVLEIAGIAFIIMVLLFGCKEFNNNPPPARTQMMAVDVKAIQRQLTYLTGSSSINGRIKPESSFVNQESEVSNAAKTLLIGAMVVTKRSSPYSRSLSFAAGIRSFFGSDLTNSANYFTFVNLPLAGDIVEFKVPPPSAGNWQAMVVAFNTQPENIGDLSDIAYKNSAIYFGITPRFYSSNDIGRSPLQIIIKRVCFAATPPKGCATFAASLSGTPIVTASVEIIGVKVNGVDYLSTLVDFPVFVRTESDIISAESKLGIVREEIIGLFSSISSLTVYTTHAENPYESDTCKSLADETDYANTKLKTNCDIAEFTVTF